MQQIRNRVATFGLKDCSNIERRTSNLELFVAVGVCGDVRCTFFCRELRAGMRAELAGGTRCPTGNTFYEYRRSKKETKRKTSFLLGI
jgi:hypothetical protein